MPVAGSRNASLHKKEGCHCLKWVTSGKNAKATDVEATLADVPPNCILRQKDRPENMQDLIEGLHLLFANERVNIDLVIKWMEAYPGNKQDWKKFEKIDKYRYTRNLVDDGNGKFNLMLLAWGEGMGSSIHDHADAHCCMKILDGELKSTELTNESCPLSCLALQKQTCRKPFTIGRRQAKRIRRRKSKMSRRFTGGLRGFCTRVKSPTSTTASGSTALRTRPTRAGPCLFTSTHHPLTSVPSLTSAVEERTWLKSHSTVDSGKERRSGLERTRIATWMMTTWKTDSIDEKKLL